MRIVTLWENIKHTNIYLSSPRGRRESERGNKFIKRKNR